MTEEQTRETRSALLDTAQRLYESGGTEAMSFRAIAEEYDHHDLNALDDFKTINPSSENIARVIFKRLAASIDDPTLSMHKVRVHETEGSCVTYREDV